MTAKDNPGPVALAHTNNYASMLVAKQCDDLVKGLGELRERRGLVPDSWLESAEDIVSRCALFSERIKKEVLT